MNFALSPAHRLLLRAALGEGDDALGAWRSWRDAVDFDAIDGESVRLVPLLYRNLARLGVDRAELGRYVSVYRHTWVKNRLAFATCAEAIAILEEAGIETLLLKGGALALRHYPDQGARAMLDLDVLVRPARAQEAFARLVARGWTRMGRSDLRVLRDRDMVRMNGVGLASPEGRALDLHWYAGADLRTPGADDGFWRAAVPVELAGRKTRALGPTDLLYTVVVHGFTSYERHVRWAADATMIIAGGEVDWRRLLALAQARRMVLPLRAALGVLRDELGTAVPAEAIEAFAGARVDRVDRYEYEHRVSARPFTTSKVLLRLWTTYRRGSAAHGPALALGFVPYLADYYDLDDPRRALPHALSRAVQRLRSQGF